MPSTVLNSLTFTPAVAGKLIVTATYSSRRSVGSDWGSGADTRCYMTQGGTTYYGDSMSMSTTRQSQIARSVFTVAAGSSLTAGLSGEVTGASAASWWDITLTAEFIKK